MSCIQDVKQGIYGPEIIISIEYEQDHTFQRIVQLCIHFESLLLFQSIFLKVRKHSAQIRFAIFELHEIGNYFNSALLGFRS